MFSGTYIFVNLGNGGRGGTVLQGGLNRGKGLNRRNMVYL